MQWVQAHRLCLVPGKRLVKMDVSPNTALGNKCNISILRVLWRIHLANWFGLELYLPLLTSCVGVAK